MTATAPSTEGRLPPSLAVALRQPSNASGEATRVSSALRPVGSGAGVRGLWSRDSDARGDMQWVCNGCGYASSRPGPTPSRRSADRPGRTFVPARTAPRLSARPAFRRLSHPRGSPRKPRLHQRPPPHPADTVRAGRPRSSASGCVSWPAQPAPDSGGNAAPAPAAVPCNQWPDARADHCSGRRRPPRTPAATSTRASPLAPEPGSVSLDANHALADRARTFGCLR